MTTSTRLGVRPELNLTALQLQALEQVTQAPRASVSLAVKCVVVRLPEPLHVKGLSTVAGRIKRSGSGKWQC